MTKRSFFYLLMVFLLYPVIGYGQVQWEICPKAEALQVLKKINAKMHTAKTLEVDMEHRITDLHDASMILHSNGYFKRKDSVFMKSKVFGIETIQNKQFKVVIDSQSNSVVVARPAAMTPVADLATFEQYFDQYPVTKVMKGKNAEGKSTYIIDFAGDDFPMDEMRFSYNEDYLLTEFTLDLNKSSNESHPEAKTRTTIRFSNYRINKSLGDKDFSVHHIIQKNNDRIVPTGKYVKFELINTYR